MRLVVVESPYAGDTVANVAYAKACLRDCIDRGEAPIASHVLYTLPGILDDLIPSERQLGIEAGLAWRGKTEYAVFYVDRGWSSGMLSARTLYDNDGTPYEIRRLYEGANDDESVRGVEPGCDAGAPR